MSMDKESRMLRIINLLMTQTLDGTLEWKDIYPRGYQTTLGGQSVAVSKDSNLASVLSQAALGVGGAVLEIRGHKGEILERVAPLGIAQPLLAEAYRFGPTVNEAVNALYDLVANRKEAISEAAIDNLLEALESRAR